MPLQFYQAYSICYYRPKPSPLRDEVGDLWEWRTQPSVIKPLKPFLTPASLTERLEFHKAVMRWKCSLLTPEEEQEHLDWIAKNLADKEEAIKRPWKAMQETGADELAKENEHIQRYVFLLPSSMIRKLT